MATKESDNTVGFIGAGQMATALARGLTTGGFTRPALVVASDVSPDARNRFTKQTGCRVVESNRELLNEAEIIVLSVKPQHARAVLAEIKDGITRKHLVISIAAGVRLSTLTGSLGADRRVVRVMPNTPCLVGAAAAGFSIGGTADDKDAALVKRFLSCVGLSFDLPEPLLDAVTGLSGSGPAYAYLVIESLSDGGVRAGLSRDVATKLAAQTMLGAARMVLETGLHPGELKDAVTSAGGTTIAGLAELEAGGVRSAMINAVYAATLRSRELGQSS